MKCKFCNAELEDGDTRCPACGKENLPEDTQASADTAAVTETQEQTAKEAAASQTVENVNSEAAPQKKKTKAWKIVLAVLGCVVLLGVLAAAVLYGLGVDLRPRQNDIFYKDNYSAADKKAVKAADTVVATVGDRELTNGELQVYYQMSVAEFARYYGGYTAMMGLDLNKPLDEQVQDPKTGLTWQQFFLKNSVETWQRYAVLGMFAKDDGFQGDGKTDELLAKMKADLEITAQGAGLADVGELVAKEMGASATEEGYFGYLRAYYESLAYYDKIYDDMIPSEEEIEDHFAENEDKFAEAGIKKDSGNYVDVRHILLVPEGTKDETGNYSDEAWAACQQKAQSVLDEWLAGDPTEENFAVLAGTYSVDGSRTNGGLYTQVQKGQMVKPFEDWCFDESRKTGDYGLVRSEFGYHVMYFVNSGEIWHYNAMGDLMTERTNAMLEDGMKRWPMQVNYKKMVLSVVGAEETKPTVPTIGADATEATQQSQPTEGNQTEETK